LSLLFVKKEEVFLDNHALISIISYTTRKSHATVPALKRDALTSFHTKLFGIISALFIIMTFDRISILG
jgi:hypothetical protein